MSTSTPEPTLPERGETFNETQRSPDEVTLRPTPQLTQHRQRNQMPTYHLNNGFSKESRYLALMTYDARVGSAILRADVETGDLTVVDRTYPGDPAHFTEGNDMAMCMEAGLIVSKLGEDALVAYDVETLDKRVLLEDLEPGYHYGHASSDSTKPALITDGLITPDLITAIYWQGRNTLDLPRIEIMGRHRTYRKHGQHFDPHCLMSSDGRWLSYNRGYRDGRGHLLAAGGGVIRSRGGIAQSRMLPVQYG